MMIQGDPTTWLSNLYNQLELNDKGERPNISQTLRRKCDIVKDLGLILQTSKSSETCDLKYKKRSSIMLGELLGEKQTSSVIMLAGLSDAVNDLKYNRKVRNPTFKIRSVQKRTSVKNFESQNFANSSVHSYNNSPKSKAQEINPIFFKKINEILEKSKFLSQDTKKFTQQINKITKIRESLKLTKCEKTQIGNSLKMM